MTDKYEYGLVSDCCGAQIIYEDICESCKEHCEAVPEEEEPNK